MRAAALVAVAILVTAGCEEAPRPAEFADRAAVKVEVGPSPTLPMMAPTPVPAAEPAARCPISTAVWSPPPASSTPGPTPLSSSAHVSNASSVVAKAATDFRRCYNAALKRDPDMKGSIRVTASIDAAGCVTAAASTSHGLDAQTIACVEARVRAMEFDPPEGGGATIVIPVVFVSAPPPVGSTAPLPKP